MIGHEDQNYIQGTYDTNVLQDVIRNQNRLQQTLGQFQLEFEPDIQRLELLLSGQIKDDEGKIIQKYEPIMNEKGRNYVMRIIRTWLSKNTAQSNFDKEIINTWCRVTMITQTADVYSHADDWDMSEDEFTSFIEICDFVKYSVMCSAEGGGLRNTITQITKTIETMYVNPPEQKKKISL